LRTLLRSFDIGHIQEFIYRPAQARSVLQGLGMIMDKETFYKRLIQSMAQAEFRFRARELSAKHANPNQDGRFSALRTGLSLAAFIAASIADINTYVSPMALTRTDVNFDQRAFQKELDNIYEYTQLVCFKYVLAQLVISAVAEADQLSHEQLIAMAKKFDGVLQELLEFSGRMGGVGWGKNRLGSVKLNVWGILLPVFFDHELALSFIDRAQGDCKTLRFGKKAGVLPWVFDVSAREIKRHRGVPLAGSGSLLNADKLVKDVFSA
jgi:hypothetical protein